MTEELPTEGGDRDTWGGKLNGFLRVAHAEDGTIKQVPEGLGVPLTVGEATFDRRFLGSPGAGTSGDLQLSYFVACKTETITQLAMYTAGTTAAGVTTIKYGVYSVAANNDLALIVGTANDTGLFAVASTRYPKALLSSWAKVAGVRYAVGYLVVATTVPSVYAPSDIGASVADTVWGREPRLSGKRAGQTDLPASIPSANIVDTRRNPFVECLL